MNAARLPLRIGAIAGALLWLGGAALAQTTATTAPPKAKPKPAAAKRTTPPNPKNDYWSVDYTQTRYDTGGTFRRDTTELTGELGRVPLQSGQGTVGFDTTTRVTCDVPGGVDPYARKDSSFVGLSINVPSVSKSLTLPILPAPPQ
jgi:hypothetical protein